LSRVRLEGVTKRFGDVVAVDDLTLEIADQDDRAKILPAAPGDFGARQTRELGQNRRLHGVRERRLAGQQEPPGRSRVFRLRRTLRQLESTAGRMEEMTRKLAEVEQPAIDVRARPYFRDTYDHARRVVSRVRIDLDGLSNMLEVASLLEQSRQGAITRQLAAWAAILAVPTAIAGIYGMNFEYMPELRQPWGYPAVMALIGSICGGLWLRFKQINWL